GRPRPGSRLDRGVPGGLVHVGLEGRRDRGAGLAPPRQPGARLADRAARGGPRLCSRPRDWRTVNLAVAGTGFKNPGWTGQPIGSLVANAVRQHPDLIVLAGGHNDSRWSTAATARAADAVIYRLRRAEPGDEPVIVAPLLAQRS